MPPKPKLLIAVTASISCVFYRGMLRYLDDAGFSTMLVSAPGDLLQQVSKSEGSESMAIPMEREIHLLRDLRSLGSLYRAMRAAQPELVDVSTPKAGLLGSMAAMLARVPCRVYTLRGLRMETASGFKRLILWLGGGKGGACLPRVVPGGGGLRLWGVE